MKKFVCSVCGYVHEGDSAPERCPQCKVPADKFNEVKENERTWAAEHVVGVAKGVPEEIIEGEITDASKLAILQKAREWHIRGFKLAQEIRKRLPLNVILIYEQSWDVAYGLHYFERDKGRIIFDPRKIDRNPDRFSR